MDVMDLIGVRSDFVDYAGSDVRIRNLMDS